MSRPALPTIAQAEEDDVITWFVQATDSQWQLTYRGSPVAVKQRVYQEFGPIFRFPRSCYNHRKHCENFRDKMNQLFKTSDFGVVELVPREDSDS